MLNLKATTSLLVLGTFLIGSQVIAGSSKGDGSDNKDKSKIVVKLRKNSDDGKNQPARQVSQATEKHVDQTAESLEEQLKNLRLQREIEEEKARLAEAKARTKTAVDEEEKPNTSPMPQQEQEGIDIFGGRSQERVEHNVDKEIERGAQSLNNFLNGNGWKSDKRLRKRERKRAAREAAKKGNGANSNN